MMMMTTRAEGETERERTSQKCHARLQRAEEVTVDESESSLVGCTLVVGEEKGNEMDAGEVS